MIQDIAPHTYHNEYKPVAPDKSSHILAYEEGKMAIDGKVSERPFLSYSTLLEGAKVRFEMESEK